jgi:hypothetical protein
MLALFGFSVHFTASEPHGSEVNLANRAFEKEISARGSDSGRRFECLFNPKSDLSSFADRSMSISSPQEECWRRKIAKWHNQVPSRDPVVFSSLSRLLRISCSEIPGISQVNAVLSWKSSLRRFSTDFRNLIVMPMKWKERTAERTNKKRREQWRGPVLGCSIAPDVSD